MEIREGDITFSFDDNFWSDILLFDRANPDYTKLEKLNNAKAIDILGHHAQHGLFLIEIKDFRSFRIGNKDRLKKKELFEEVGQKVKDSLACALAGARNSTNHRAYWNRQVDLIKNPDLKVNVLLWLEEDTNVTFGEPTGKANMSIYINLLKKKVSWLTKKVKILNSRKRDSLDTLNISVTLHRPES